MSSQMIDIMLPAFVECLVLVGIHSYLGIHVIKRKVIFVDLALAQIAALGSTVAFLFNIDPTSSGAYWFSLGFTLIGAAIFSISRLRYEKIPQEAVIGLVYALAAATSILVIDKAPHGAEHIKEILTGSILWVRWETILKAAIVYSVIGFVHFLFKDKFLLISNNPDKAYEMGLKIRWWDFLFYATFGIVITHSVGTAGVLLVFVFLVVPAIATISVTDKLWLQLVLGWTMGTIVTMIGLYVSYVADIPSGPTVVATYGMVLLIHSLILYILRAENRVLALRNIGLGVVGVILTAIVFIEMGHYFQKHQQVAETVSQEAGIQHASTEKATGTAVAEGSDGVQQVSPNSNAADTENIMTNSPPNEFAKFQELKKLTEKDPKRGTKALIDFLESSRVPFLKDQARKMLKKYANTDFGYDPSGSAAENRKALQKMRIWWKHRFNGT